MGASHLRLVSMRMLFKLAIGAVVATIVGDMAVADDVVGITVETSRQLAITQGIDSTKVSLSHPVSAKGLDLTTATGASELEMRVKDAAEAVCKEIGKLYPDSRPTAEECAKNASGKAMHRVHEMVAEAKKKAGN
jgi:UrcA family protein